jgi:hypothetical protein
MHQVVNSYGNLCIIVTIDSITWDAISRYKCINISRCGGNLAYSGLKCELLKQGIMVPAWCFSGYESNGNHMRSGLMLHCLNVHLVLQELTQYGSALLDQVVTISDITLCMFVREMFVQPVALLRTIQNECSNRISLLGSTSCCYFIANMLGVVKFTQSSSWDWLVGAQLHIGHFVQMLVVVGS